MGNIILSLVLCVLTYTVFTTNRSISGINRILYNVPISIFESSIPLVQDSDEPIIYYDKTELEFKLTSYFDNEIPRYTDDYTISYYYYNQSNNSLCLSDYCNAVEIRINAKISFYLTYKKSASFYIQKN